MCPSLWVTNQTNSCIYRLTCCWIYILSNNFSKIHPFFICAYPFSSSSIFINKILCIFIRTIKNTSTFSVIIISFDMFSLFTSINFSIESVNSPFASLWSLTIPLGKDSILLGLASPYFYRTWKNLGCQYFLKFFVIWIHLPECYHFNTIKQQYLLVFQLPYLGLYTLSYFLTCRKQY